MVTALHHFMDIEEDPDLIYGEEFCFPATTTYYPILHSPTGLNMPGEFYEHPTISGFNNQGLHYAGQQAEGTSRMYYVVPEYEIAHPPHGSQPFHLIAHPSHGIHPLHPVAHPPHGYHPAHPCAIANGLLSGGQEYCTETVEHTYYQQVRTSHYAVLPSVADRTPPINAQPLADTSGLFLPGGSDQTVDAASERGVAWNSSLQSVSVSSMKFQNPAVVPEGLPCGVDPWKQQLADRSRLPARLLHVQLASRQSAVPSVHSSLQTIFSCNNHVTNIGSDFRKMSAEKSHHRSKTSSYAKQRLSFLDQQNISKQKPICSMPSEITVKSYTSRLHIGDPKGNIILRTDQYNRDDFRVVYPNAKFFVIKSFDEADIHKSIKYGVWSTSGTGNKKLDRAFRVAQAIAANGSSSCPVFLFFSVNQSFRFCGVAEMVGPVHWQKDMDFWSTNKWRGNFPVKWHIIKNVYNSALRRILLENNEDKPVTSSRSTQEIHYIPGTSMLKIFKCARADGCLLDEFMMHEEEEARSSQRRRSKLRQAAPQFMPASMHARHSYNTQLPKSSQLMHASMNDHHTYNILFPKFPQFMPNTLLPPRSDSVVMNRIISETNDLTGKLQGLNLDRHQSSWQEFGILTSIASTADTHRYGIQTHENVVKAMTYYQAYSPLGSNMKPASGGEQQCLKVEIAPTERPQPETAASLSFKAPEKYPSEGKNDSLHSASEVPEIIAGEQKVIGKPCSVTTNSLPSQACSKPRVVTIAIGSMLIPVTISN